MAAITDQDRGPAEQDRPDPAEVLAASLATGELTGQGRAEAETELLDRLHGAALPLRRSVADSLKSSPHVPGSLLMALVRDHDSVSLPILEHSPVLEAADVAAALLADDGRDCSEPVMMACLDRWPASDAVQRALIDRAKLPPAVALRLVALASDELSERLVARHPVPTEPDSPTIELTRNRPDWWSQQISGYFS